MRFTVKENIVKRTILRTNELSMSSYLRPVPSAAECTYIGGEDDDDYYDEWI